MKDYVQRKPKFLFDLQGTDEVSKNFVKVSKKKRRHKEGTGGPQLFKQTITESNMHDTTFADGTHYKHNATATAAENKVTRQSVSRVDRESGVMKHPGSTEAYFKQQQPIRSSTAG